MDVMKRLPRQSWWQKYHLKTISLVIITGLLIILSAQVSGVDLAMFWGNLDQFTNLLVRMAHPDWAYITIIGQPILETIQMAIIGTTIGTCFAIPLAFLAASNIVQNSWIRGLVRFGLDLVRTLPDLLLAAIFVAVFGIGATAGVVTLAIFSFGMVSKLFYEVIETIDEGPIEAMKSVGARKLQIIHFAVVPQVLNQFISYFLYTLEINVRASTVLGYLGAGGIGVYLQRSLNEFNYSQTAVIIIMTLVVVFIINIISNYLRERLM